MQIEAWDSRQSETWQAMNDAIATLDIEVSEKEAAQPLPPGWRYRREVTSEPFGNTWKLSVTSIPEPIYVIDD